MRLARNAAKAASGFLFLGLSIFWSAADATENGLSNFPVGAVTTASGFLPPPGATEMYGYILLYNATHFRDDAGQRVPGLSAVLFAQAPRVVHTWVPTIGPFAISSGVVIETDYAKVRQGSQRDEAVNLDLIGLEPFDLTAHWGNWHFMTGTELYYPVGPYHPDKIVNTSTHYAAYAQQFGVSWIPNPKTEVSVNTDVEVNMRNNATGYRSGDQFGFTYGFGYRPFDNAQQWQLGFSGFYSYQFTDDHLHGDEVPTGFRLKKNAVGPKAAYWFSPGAAVIAQWQHEMGVRNGFQGDLYWLEFAFPM